MRPTPRPAALMDTHTPHPRTDEQKVKEKEANKDMTTAMPLPMPLPSRCRHEHGQPTQTDGQSDSYSSPLESLESEWSGGADGVSVSKSARMHSRDAWVWRRGDRAQLVPLSGAIPFNGEPPLSRLAQLLSTAAATPTRLHHVRNHGAVPRIDADSFRLKVCVNSKGDGREWSVADLRAMPSQTLLASLSCDGLRRKELNLLEHTKGFDTGPGAAGNSFWTGVLLCDLLEASGVDLQAEAAKAEATEGDATHRFVCFDGSSFEDLPHGLYGTSLPLAYALDRRNAVMVAFEQNGEPLWPDHGAPLRLVAPGLVGGRWVKWLSRIALTSRECSSEYHVNDNRVVPGSVGVVDLNAGRTRGQPQWTLYELNVQCVITSPSHDEIAQLAVTEGRVEPQQVQVAGFAFAGGGRRIVVVEVSADGGRSWTTAKLRYTDLDGGPDDKEKKQADDEHRSRAQDASSGVQPAEEDAALQRCQAEWQRGRMAETAGMSARPKCWSWCWWSASIPVWSVLGGGGGGELIARAFDEAHNGQPERLQWNATGMLNNAWYRVRVQQCESGPAAPPALRFLHPVLPGLQRGGWMDCDQSNGSPVARPPHMSASSGVPLSLAHVGPLIGVAAHKAHKLITLSEVERHRRPDDCWIVMDQQVFDVSAYMQTHPGGPHALLAAAHTPLGQLEALFRSIHSADAIEITGRFLIGVVASDALVEALTAAHGDAITRRTPARAKDGAETAAPVRRFWSDFNVAEDTETEITCSAAVAKEKREAKSSREQKSTGSDDEAGVSLRRQPRVSLPGSQNLLEHHRRPNWHEQPDPDRAHPHTGATLFPRSRGSGGDSFLLHSTRWCNVELSAVRQISPDTKVFVFRSSDGSFSRLGLTTGQHLLLAALIDDEWVVRPYTPIRPVSLEEDDGPISVAPQAAEFELLIKIYRPTKGLPGGRLTQHLDSLKVGGSGGGRLRVQGPTGFVLYEGRGQFNIHTVAVQVRRINLIGGGTGITPLWQLMRAILALGGAEERRAAVQVSLVFANSTPRDILLREEIEELARSQPQRCRVCFVVSRLEEAEQHKGHAQPSASSPPVKQPLQQQQPPEDPTPQAASPPNVCVAAGRISALLFRHHLHPPSSDTLTFVCGPPPMVQAAYQHLFQLAFRDEQIVEF